MPLFARVNPGDITVRHALTGERFRLHSYRHRGFWFHGRNREGASVELWAQLIKPGDTVVEVGAHIGFLTTFFASLVGPDGRVVAFEPGDNNLPYLRKNTADLANVEVQPFAVGDHDGEVTFFLEGLTGQNNSLSSDYSAFHDNVASAHSHASYVETTVEMVSLDTFCTESATTPDWLKIDVEGHELDVLRGGCSMIESARPAITLEITRLHHEADAFLRDLGYAIYHPVTRRFVAVVDASGDYFAFHPGRHDGFIRQLTPASS